MKVIISILTISTLFWSCVDEEEKPIEELKPTLKMIDDSTGNITILTDGKLLNAWVDFKKVVLSKDFYRLRALSVNCINCYLCDTSGYIPIETFYKKYFDSKFDSNFLSRMNDTAKVDGHYDDANWHIYSQDCIFKSSGMLKPRIAEIGIRISDPNSLYKGFEGGTATIAFIETASGYRFCGYSTIP